MGGGGEGEGILEREERGYETERRGMTLELGGLSLSWAHIFSPFLYRWMEGCGGGELDG